MATANPPKKLKMDFGEFDSFVFKHSRLFEHNTFCFKGYVPEVKKALEDVVRDMSAGIDDSIFGYLISDHFIFASANDGRPHYSIAYLAHCIRAEKCLDIHDYRFVPLKNNAVYLDCHCIDIKYILDAKYWPNDDFKNIKCSLCYEAEMLVKGDPEGDDVFIVEKRAS